MRHLLNNRAPAADQGGGQGSALPQVQPGSAAPEGGGGEEPSQEVAALRHAATGHAQDALHGRGTRRGFARILPFLGPAFIAAVAYMDPGNFATNIQGGAKYGYMLIWVIVASLVVCLATWFITERTRLGSYLRAATENAVVVRAFGINVPRMITITYGLGVALAALAGVLAAPIYQVSPQMGANLIIVVFAVVVIGGMGSILGAILTGFGLGVIEGFTKVFYPEASNTVIFVIMAIVLLIKPAGLFGRER
jgi:branched-chain amino acid transport system permease protein